MGIMGACRTSEIHAIKVNDIVDINKTMLVTIPVTKTKSVRKFTITGKFYNVVQKYINLRPPNVSTDSLFLNYQKGKCTCQNIGVNKISKMGKEIANYLKLPEAEKYTGHSFRRSSATILVDAGADITALKTRWLEVHNGSRRLYRHVHEKQDGLSEQNYQCSSSFE
jgi:integrase